MVSLLDLLELAGDVLEFTPLRRFRRNDDDAAPRRKRTERLKDEGVKGQHRLFSRSKSGPTDNG
ncbi:MULTISPECIES: hypothetical protein [unclassified Novosphingobium]|uniref:hypothetical protein n=1 Tax=unclassified Novosphingobium TaxID=2644732 RepID=UPI001ACC1018|nr:MULTISPECIES: hypothetical protein [unclassified Novosphingobium]MBN9144808.1 hypothetical protein [Novosphingobium sp.]MDR6708097.1 hypothetical protein [Novosphingobium sp. 1748]